MEPRSRSSWTSRPFSCRSDEGAPAVGSGGRVRGRAAVPGRTLPNGPTRRRTAGPDQRARCISWMRLVRTSELPVPVDEEMRHCLYGCLSAVLNIIEDTGHLKTERIRPGQADGAIVVGVGRATQPERHCGRSANITAEAVVQLTPAVHVDGKVGIADQDLQRVRQLRGELEVRNRGSLVTSTGTPLADVDRRTAEQEEIRRFVQHPECERRFKPRHVRSRAQFANVGTRGWLSRRRGVRSAAQSPERGEHERRQGSGSGTSQRERRPRFDSSVSASSFPQGQGGARRMVGCYG